MDVIQFFNDVADSEEALSRITHKLCRNIIQGLDETTLRELRSQANLDWYLRKLVGARLEKQGPSDATPIQYNKSWRAYLKDIQQRKLGRITLARKKLREAFPHIEWQAQCKILSFFLQDSSKDARTWALQTLMYQWEMFAGRAERLRSQWVAMVLGLWEKHKERDVALFIIRHADEACVLRLDQELAKVVGYQRVALRLGANPHYELDISRLSTLEWLYAMAKLQRPVCREACEAALAEMLMETIARNSCPPMRQIDTFSFALDDQVSLALWCLGELKHPDLIMDFAFCDRRLQTDLSYLRNLSISPEKYWEVMCRAAPSYFSLPRIREYKLERFEEFLKRYPIFRDLVEKYGFGIA